MMKPFLLGVTLAAIGFAPVRADPRHGGGVPGVGFARDGGGERPGFAGRPAFRGGPAFEGRRAFEDRRAMEMDEEDRPMPMRHRADQDRARDQMRAGAIRPLRDIQQQWRQDMPGYDFLGSDYDPGAGSYRLKFLRDGSVLWIDVDGRTGREIGRRGR